MKTLEEGWKTLSSMMIPQDASPDQYRDMRAAYYGGALVVFELTIKASSKKHREAMRDMDAIHEELASGVTGIMDIQ